MVDGVPVFTAADEPTAIVDRYGEWLAGALRFSWRGSDRTAWVRRGEQVLGVRLEGSGYNLAGDGTHVDVVLSVEDDRLGRWRLEHPELASRPDPLLWGSYLINLVGAGRGSVELFGRLHDSYLSPADLVPVLRDEVLPPLELLRDPQAAADAFPPRWFIEPAYFVEWAVAVGHPAVARLFASRVLADNPQLLPSVEAGRAAVRRGEPADEVHHSGVIFGRALAALEILGVDEPLVPPEPQRGWLSKLRRAGRG